MGSLIIIRGPLGIGKSTVAKKLAKNISGDYISVDEVLTEYNLDNIDEKEGCIPLKNFLKVNEYILPKIEQTIKNGISVVVDGNFYHRNQIEDLIKNFPRIFIFTLMAPLDICLQRDSRRQKSYGTGATTAVYKLVSRFEYGKVIDVSSKSVGETVNFIVSNLA